MGRQNKAVNAECVIFDPDLFTDLMPMADLHDTVGREKVPAYLLSGVPDEHGLSRLHVSVLARHLAPILFPEGKHNG